METKICAMFAPGECPCCSAWTPAAARARRATRRRSRIIRAYERGDRAELDYLRQVRGI